LRVAAGKDEAHAAVRRVTGELAGLAEKAAHDAQCLLANANVALRRARTKARRLAQ
jgi:IS5 family transposase